MNRRPVQSSNVSSVGWEADGDTGVGTLEVAFKSGHVYRYAEVPQSVYLDFLGASSIGRYFQTEINGRYEHSRVK